MYFSHTEHTLQSNEIRSSIVSHVNNNWERFKMYTDDGSGNNYLTKEHYCDNMLKIATYGELHYDSMFIGMVISTTIWRRKQSSKETPVQWFLNSDHFDVYVLLYSFMQEGPNHFILEDPKLMMKPVVYLNEITMDVDEKNEEIPK